MIAPLTQRTSTLRRRSRLIGIEVLDASRKLHPALLKKAEIIAPMAAAKQKLG